MRDNATYEFSRDEYVTFIGQLDKTKMKIEYEKEGDLAILKVRSMATGKHLTSRIIPDEGEEHYYIFNSPEDDERVPPKPVMKVKLETREEVQNFFNLLSKLTKEHKDG